MKSFGTFSEDIETRRQELRQKQQQQAASFKEKGAAVNQAAQERLAAQKEKQAENQERADAAKAASDTGPKINTVVTGWKQEEDISF